MPFCQWQCLMTFCLSCIFVHDIFFLVKFCQVTHCGTVYIYKSVKLQLKMSSAFVKFFQRCYSMCLDPYLCKCIFWQVAPFLYFYWCQTVSNSIMQSFQGRVINSTLNANLFSSIYKLTDFGSAREQSSAEENFMSIHGTEEYLVRMLSCWWIIHINII